VETSEKMAAAAMERYYLRLKRNNIHISLEDIEDTEWMWSDREVNRFKKLWRQDATLKDMAKLLKRSEIAVFFQALDQLYKGKIKPRNWNIW
jgi:hypothetical protein